MKYPKCFTAALPPAAATTGIIDGHIQLMGAYNVTSWEQFLSNQFVRPIRQQFASGCTTVVLLFDNRLAVSPYKGMTQYKRCKRYQDVQFSQGDPLPQNPPAPWLDHMMNRYFKDRVISMVCEKIQGLIKPSREQVLIVDFKGPPKMYNDAVNCAVDIPGLKEMGESDVKFTRYVHMLGNSVVYATDGDYLAISLLYYATHGVAPGNQIFIYRQLANVDKPTAAAKTKKPDAAKPRRRMEFVNMQAVFWAALDIMRCRKEELARPAIIAFVTTMLLAGTDYSRSIPLVGPRKIIDIMPFITKEMHSILVEDNGVLQPVPSKMADVLTATIYFHAFRNHFFWIDPKFSIETALSTLQKTPKISDRNKGMLPSAKQVLTTCRNVSWVVHYWKDCINEAPDLTQALMYGFVYNPKTRQYTWPDLLETDADVDPVERKRKNQPQSAQEDEPSMLVLMDPTVMLTPMQHQVDKLDVAATAILQNR